MIQKVLIANRGEIAVRILRTCREIGIRTVAIYSDIDWNLPHVILADEAVHISGSSPMETYLNIPKIISIARERAVQAIHPGYGFLAENPVFAEETQKAGLIFIGPSPEAMRLMGNKTEARQKMKSAGVPIVPGTEAPLQSTREAEEIAGEIGYPVLIKAAAGGGGKGMRVIRSQAELPAAFERARSEAKSAFADDRIYLEKYLEKPRHIEFQILADMHGNTIHLGERECSIQRRYQKVIEESPSPIISEEMRAEMGKAAVQAAQSVGYTGAGTIEFLVDKKLNFYFLEMNTRIQVEHPITELRTGIDLVKEQIRIAAGEKISAAALNPIFTGHAIECRIYAEDSDNNFVPSTGTLVDFSPPDGFGIRFDGGVTCGNEISPYYDPMIGKLIAHGTDRDEAISRMLRAIREFRIVGVKTSLPFCRQVLKHPEFLEGNYDTHFVEKHLKSMMRENLDQSLLKIAAAAAAFHHSNLKPHLETPSNNHHGSKYSPWKISGRREQIQ